MFKFQGFCPQCGENVPQERYVGGRPICACGWQDESSTLSMEGKIEREASLGFVALTVALVAIVGHCFAWGSHAFSIPGLKAAQWTGMLSASGYRELAQDCLDLGKTAQAERAYLDMFRSAHDPEGLALLASLQAREGKAPAAAQTYAVYFSSGGRSTDALSGYARALEATGQIDEAIKRYDEAAANTNLLPVTATTGVVRLLIAQHRFDEAYSRILRFQASAENAKGYLNSERSNLESWLGPKAVAAIQQRANAQAAATSKAPRAG